jgi:CDP-diacylglycerol--glycerol-3-phosphate 3-phosphatidyltransferase
MFTVSTLRYVPNVLTVARILMTPVVLLLCTVPTFAAQSGAVVLFVLASLSDYYDGKLARAMGARSRFGQFLDPLADKVLVLGVFGLLAMYEPQAVSWWAVVAIAARDAVVTGLRSWHETQGRTLRTFRIAKAKTLSQLAFLFGMLVLRAMSHLPVGVADRARWLLDDSSIPYVLMVGVVAITVGTGLLYAVAPHEESISAQS